MACGLPEVMVRLVEGPRRLGDDEIYNVDEAYKLLWSEFKDADREVTIVLLLDTCLRPINYSVVSVGSLRRSEASLANIYKTAILSNAGYIVLAHNHPSGDPEPSENDYSITGKVKEAGELLGIPLLDHIVIGEEGFVSIFDRM